MARDLTLFSIRTLLILLTAGLLAATLVRHAPGFGVDETSLDARYSSAQDETVARVGALTHYRNFLVGIWRGDLGVSSTFNQPVFELLRERFPVSLRSLLLSLALCWTAGLAMAAVGVLRLVPGSDAAASILSASLLSMPAGVMALAAMWSMQPVEVAIAAILLPKIFLYLRSLFARAAEQACVFAARARGVGAGLLLWRYFIRPSARELAALFGVSVNLAIGVMIPVEAICDHAGLGQLAWKAALGRDLPLLVNCTLLVAAATLVANGLVSMRTTSSA